MSPELQTLLDQHTRTYQALTLDQRLAYDREQQEAQRASWIRAFEPCEHGDPDWETCPQCLASFRDKDSERG